MTSQDDQSDQFDVGVGPWQGLWPTVEKQASEFLARATAATSATSTATGRARRPLSISTYEVVIEVVAGAAGTRVARTTVGARFRTPTTTSPTATRTWPREHTTGYRYTHDFAIGAQHPR